MSDKALAAVGAQSGGAEQDAAEGTAIPARKPNVAKKAANLL